MELTVDLLNDLGQPFPPEELDFLPRGNSNGRALALPYVDARTIMRRLDAVVGPANWSFDFDLLSPEGKMVRGKLTVCGVTKCDAGEGDKEEEVLKSAVSDALKRAAVHFGIGRYLYHLPQLWAPFDPAKRRFTEKPLYTIQQVEQALQVAGISPKARKAPEAPRQVNPTAQRAVEAAERPLSPEAAAEFKTLHQEVGRLYTATGKPSDPDSFWKWAHSIVGGKLRRSWNDFTYPELADLKKRLETDLAQAAAPGPASPRQLFNASSNNEAPERPGVTH